jgi:hypothetical protein
LLFETADHQGGRVALVWVVAIIGMHSRLSRAVAAIEEMAAMGLSRLALVSRRRRR